MSAKNYTLRSSKKGLKCLNVVLFPSSFFVWLPDCSGVKRNGIVQKPLDIDFDEEDESLAPCRSYT